MDETKEIRETLSKMLNIPEGNIVGEASWAKIFEAIGALKERANNKPSYPMYIPPVQVDPVGKIDVHYHNGTPCHNNPCVWC